MPYTIKMKPLSEIRRKYQAGAASAPVAYKAGVSEVNNFKERAIAGQGNYEARMSDPNVLARREAKLQAMDENEWKKNALDKGVKRIGAGMLAAQDKEKKAISQFTIN